MYTVLRKIYIRYWNENLSVDVRFSKEYAYQGDTIQLVEVVTNDKIMPLPYVYLKFHLDKNFKFEDASKKDNKSDKTYRNDVFSLLMHQRITRKTDIECSKRGMYTINEIEIVTSGLFMSDICINQYTSNDILVVYPSTENVENICMIYSAVFGTLERNRQLNPDPFAFRQIREYEPTDSFNTINWKASARSGELMVNQFNETMNQSVCILLNLEKERVTELEKIDEISISIASGLTEYLINMGIEVSIMSNGKDCSVDDNIHIRKAAGKTHIELINTSLARIDLSKEKQSFIDMLEEYSDGYSKPVMEEDANNEIMYIMISKNRRLDLQESFSKLQKKNIKNVWIAPCLGDDVVELDHCDVVQIDWVV